MSSEDTLNALGEILALANGPREDSSAGALSLDPQSLFKRQRLQQLFLRKKRLEVSLRSPRIPGRTRKLRQFVRTDNAIEAVRSDGKNLPGRVAVLKQAVNSMEARALALKRGIRGAEELMRLTPPQIVDTKKAELAELQDRLVPLKKKVSEGERKLAQFESDQVSEIQQAEKAREREIQQTRKVLEREIQRVEKAQEREIQQTEKAREREIQRQAQRQEAQKPAPPTTFAVKSDGTPAELSGVPSPEIVEQAASLPSAPSFTVGADVQTNRGLQQVAPGILSPVSSSKTNLSLRPNVLTPGAVLQAELARQQLKFSQQRAVAQQEQNRISNKLAQDALDQKIRNNLFNNRLNLLKTTKEALIDENKLEIEKQKVINEAVTDHIQNGGSPAAISLPLADGRLPLGPKELSAARTRFTTNFSKIQIAFRKRGGKDPKAGAVWSQVGIPATDLGMFLGFSEESISTLNKDDVIRKYAIASGLAEGLFPNNPKYIGPAKEAAAKFLREQEFVSRFAPSDPIEVKDREGNVKLIRQPDRGVASTDKVASKTSQHQVAMVEKILEPYATRALTPEQVRSLGSFLSGSSTTSEALISEQRDALMNSLGDTARLRRNEQILDRLTALGLQIQLPELGIDPSLLRGQ